MGFNLLLTQNKGKIIHCFEKKYGGVMGKEVRMWGWGKNVCHEGVKDTKAHQDFFVTT